MTEKTTKAKGEWLPCGCRKDLHTGKMVRLCPVHQAEADKKEEAKKEK